MLQAGSVCPINDVIQINTLGPAFTNCAAAALQSDRQQILHSPEQQSGQLCIAIVISEGLASPVAKVDACI